MHVTLKTVNIPDGLIYLNNSSKRNKKEYACLNTLKK